MTAPMFNLGIVDVCRGEEARLGFPMLIVKEPGGWIAYLWHNPRTGELSNLQAPPWRKP